MADESDEITDNRKKRFRSWEERNRAAGRCTDCGKEPVCDGSKSWCTICRDRRRERALQWQLAKRFRLAGGGA